MTIWRSDRAQFDTQHDSQIYEHIHHYLLYVHCVLSVALLKKQMNE